MLPPAKARVGAWGAAISMVTARAEPDTADGERQMLRDKTDLGHDGSTGSRWYQRSMCAYCAGGERATFPSQI
jgi:hypothetical protein